MRPLAGHWRGSRLAPDPLSISLVSQRVDGAGAGDAEGMYTDCDHRDDKRGQSWSDEYRQVQVNPNRKILQPITHKQVSDRPGKQIGEQNGFDKLPVQKLQDVRDTGSKNLSDADFLCSLLSRKCGQSKKTQASNKHSKDRKNGENFGLLLLGVVKRSEAVIDKIT